MEDEMTALKTLTFTTLPKPSNKRSTGQLISLRHVSHSALREDRKSANIHTSLALSGQNHCCKMAAYFPAAVVTRKHAGVRLIRLASARPCSTSGFAYLLAQVCRSL